jgi:hypothetical protein
MDWYTSLPGSTPEHNIEYYWRPEMHHWTVHGKELMGANSSIFYRAQQPWYYKLEPIVSIIRSNIASTVYPTSWLAVDEMMVAFKGRSAHTVKVKNKAYR